MKFVGENKVTNYQEISEVLIRISSEYLSKIMCHFEKEKNILERINAWSDICSIDLVYENKTEYFYIDWNEDNDYENKYQSHKICTDGSLLICINRNRTADQAEWK